MLDRARLAMRRVLTLRPVSIGLAIFVVALVLRLALIETSRFTGDEIEMWRNARAIAAGKEFPLLGPPITDGGARLPGPLFHYMMALPLLVSKAPEACNAFVAILGAVSVVVYWAALRDFFGEMGAALAALLMACSPWSTLYADRIWNANVTGIFVALAFWAACRLRSKPSAGALVLLFASAAVIPQIHMSAPMVWVALLPIALPTARRWRWWWPLAGLAVVVLLYAPMLVSELRTHWANVRTFLAENAANGSDDYKRVPAWAFRLLTLDVSYQQLHSYWGRHTETEMLHFIVRGNADFRYGPVRWFLLGASVLLAAAALAVSLWSAWGGLVRRRPRPFFWAAVLGVLANTALLGFAHRPVYGHYVQPLLPFYFVAFAELGRWASRRTWAWWPVWGAATLVSIGAIDATLWVSYTLDARNGLWTMRRVNEALAAEEPKVSYVPLSFGFLGWPGGYNALLEMDPEPHFSIGGGGGYRLLLRETPAPSGGRKLIETGPVVLYRMR
jgi:hypothetical protein